MALYYISHIYILHTRRSSFRVHHSRVATDCRIHARPTNFGRVGLICGRSDASS